MRLPIELIGEIVEYTNFRIADILKYYIPAQTFTKIKQKNEKTMVSLSNLQRYRLFSIFQMIKMPDTRFNDNIFDIRMRNSWCEYIEFQSYFCLRCGNYITFTGRKSNKIICNCIDKRDGLYNVFKNYLIYEIPRDFGGDSWEDQFYPIPSWSYLNRILLFCITRNKKYYNNLNNNLINNILSYC